MAKICESCGKPIKWNDYWIEFGNGVYICSKCQPYYSENDNTISKEEKIAYLKDQINNENKPKSFIVEVTKLIDSIENKEKPNKEEILGRSDDYTTPTYSIPIVTTDFIVGKTILEMKGPVSSCVVFGAGALKSWASNFSAFFGSQSRGFSQKANETRYEAEKILIENAISLGANAVIDVHYSIANYYSELTGILVTGTAVVISD